MSENYFTTREAAKLLGVSARTAQQSVEKGLLEGWKTAGEHRRITRSSVRRAIKGHHHKEQKLLSSTSLPRPIVADDLYLIRLCRAQMSRWPFDVTIYTAPNGYEALLYATFGCQASAAFRSYARCAICRAIVI